MSIPLTLVQLDTVVATPHIEFVSLDLYWLLYQGSCEYCEWMQTRQLRRVTREAPTEMLDLAAWENGP